MNSLALRSELAKNERICYHVVDGMAIQYRSFWDAEKPRGRRTRDLQSCPKDLVYQ